jgi:hypothetical protein
MRQPSIKKYIQPGVLIRLDRSFYQVTELKERTFSCRPIGGKDEGQEFYYNIEMEVYQLVASNL